MINNFGYVSSYSLAKISMVAEQFGWNNPPDIGCSLAKISMVAEHY